MNYKLLIQILLTEAYFEKQILSFEKVQIILSFKKAFIMFPCIHRETQQPFVNLQIPLVTRITQNTFITQVVTLNISHYILHKPWSSIICNSGNNIDSYVFLKCNVCGIFVRNRFFLPFPYPCLLLLHFPEKKAEPPKTQQIKNHRKAKNTYCTPNNKTDGGNMYWYIKKRKGVKKMQHAYRGKFRGGRYPHIATERKFPWGMIRIHWCMYQFCLSGIWKERNILSFYQMPFYLFTDF